MHLRTLKELNVLSKKVLVCAGFDVPIISGKVAEDFRIHAALPTLRYLESHRAKIIIITTLGRPSGWEDQYSLEPVADKLAELWKKKFVVIPENSAKLPEYPIPHLYFFKHNIEKHDIRPLIEQMRERDVVVLENLRFYEGEQRNDPAFAKRLASLAAVYVGDDFSKSHRSEASIAGVPKLLPSAAGFMFEKEVSVLSRVLKHPKKPVVVMMGGAKLADKMDALLNLARTADYLLLGGEIANLIFRIRDLEVGKSFWHEKNEENMARQLWRDYKDKIQLPVDVVVATDKDSQAECVKIDKVKPNQMILDIGPESIRLFSEYLRKGQTLIWSGPLGYIEKKAFSHGTSALARLFASRTKTSVFGVAGGGETVEVIGRLGLEPYIDHVSTGGGAMLEFLAGKALPGVEALTSR